MNPLHASAGEHGSFVRADPDVTSGQCYRLESFAGKAALLVMFICRHCPYVQHIEQQLARLGRDYEGSGLGIIAISSNDHAGYPEDAPDRLKELAQRVDFRTFVLLRCHEGDREGLSRGLHASFYLFDGQRRLRLSRPTG